MSNVVSALFSPQHHQNKQAVQAASRQGAVHLIAFIQHKKPLIGVIFFYSSHRTAGQFHWRSTGTFFLLPFARGQSQ
jgi:hypothetical protein